MKCMQSFSGKSRGKETFREDNIKMDWREVGSDPGEWIDLAEDRDQCQGGNEPPGTLKANQLVSQLENKSTDFFVLKLMFGNLELTD